MTFTPQRFPLSPKKRVARLMGGYFFLVLTE
jgi:hypothetical protein